MKILRPANLENTIKVLVPRKMIQTQKPFDKAISIERLDQIGQIILQKIYKEQPELHVVPHWLLSQDITYTFTIYHSVMQDIELKPLIEKALQEAENKLSGMLFILETKYQELEETDTDPCPNDHKTAKYHQCQLCEQTPRRIPRQNELVNK